MNMAVKQGKAEAELPRIKADNSRSPADGITPLAPRDKWFLPDAESAAETPTFFKPVMAERLDLISTLRSEAAEIVEKSLPKTSDDLYLGLLPAIVRYADDLFGRLADAKMQNGGQPRSYKRWLDKCVEAVTSDCCDGFLSQFPTTVGLLTQHITERQSPETFRALVGLWGAWNPFSNAPFSGDLKNYLDTHLRTQTRLRALAKARENLIANGPTKERTLVARREWSALR